VGHSLQEMHVNLWSHLKGTFIDQSKNISNSLTVSLLGTSHTGRKRGNVGQSIKVRGYELILM